MNFGFSEEQEELRRAVRAFFAERQPESKVRHWMEQREDFDRELWRTMAVELGLAGLAIDERHGGAGAGFTELAVVLEECGRALDMTPFLSTAVLGVKALKLAADETVQDEYLPQIAAGEKVTGLAIAEDDGRWDTSCSTQAVPEPGGTERLHGRKSYVLDGAVADLLIVSARCQDGTGLYAVDPHETGVRRIALKTIDATRRLARITFDRVPARRLCGPERAETALRELLDIAAVALALEAVGGAQKCLEMAVEYAGQRHQFGRPIGSFQAIKHKAADMVLHTESAKSAAYWAAWAADDGPADLPRAAALAKAYCGDAFVLAAGHNIQIHGGIGFTWEHPAHLYLKRAKSGQQLFGAPDLHRERLLKLTEGDRAPARR